MAAGRSMLWHKSSIWFTAGSTLLAMLQHPPANAVMRSRDAFTSMSAKRMRRTSVDCKGRHVLTAHIGA